MSLLIAPPWAVGASADLTAPGAALRSVSCASAGNCVAVGQFKRATAGFVLESFTMSLVSGTWENARPAVFAANVQNSTPDARFASVSCASAGDCVAVGKFRAPSVAAEAFTMTAVDNTPATTVASATTLASSGPSLVNSSNQSKLTRVPGRSEGDRGWPDGCAYGGDSR